MTFKRSIARHVLYHRASTTPLELLTVKPKQTQPQNKYERTQSIGKMKLRKQLDKKSYFKPNPDDTIQLQPAPELELHAADHELGRGRHGVLRHQLAPQRGPILHRRHHPEPQRVLRIRRSGP